MQTNFQCTTPLGVPIIPGNMPSRNTGANNAAPAITLPSLGASGAASNDGNHPSTGLSRQDTPLCTALSRYVRLPCRFGNGTEAELEGVLSHNGQQFHVAMGIEPVTMKVIGKESERTIYGPAREWQYCRIPDTFEKTMLPGWTGLDGRFHTAASGEDGQRRHYILSAHEEHGERVFGQGNVGGMGLKKSELADMIANCRAHGYQALTDILNGDNGLERLQAFFRQSDEVGKWMGLKTSWRRFSADALIKPDSQGVDPVLHFAGGVERTETTDKLIAADEQGKAIALYACVALEAKQQQEMLILLSRFMDDARTLPRQKLGVMLVLAEYRPMLDKDNHERAFDEIFAKRHLDALFKSSSVAVRMHTELKQLQGHLKGYASEHGVGAFLERLQRHLQDAGIGDVTATRSADNEIGLHAAARQGDLEKLKKLIEEGKIPVDAEDADKRTALEWAARLGKIEIVRYLLEEAPKTAKATHHDRHEWTALHWAADNGHDKIVDLLLKHGADLFAQGKEGWTAVHWAVHSGHLTIAEKLLRKAESLPHPEKPKDPENPEAEQKQGGHKFLVEMLDTDGCSLLHCAVDSGKNEIAKLILGYGPEIDAHNEDGMGAIHIAARKGDHAMFKLLLEHGAKVDAVTRERETPFDLAARRGDDTHARFITAYLDHLATQDRTARTQAFKDSKTLHDWFGVHRSGSLLSKASRSEPKATLRQYKAFIRDVDDKHLKAEAVKQFHKVRAQTVMRDTVIKADAAELEATLYVNQGASGKQMNEIVRLLRHAAKDPAAFDQEDHALRDVLRHVFDTSDKLLRWIGFQFGGARSIRRGFLRYGKTVEWDDRSITANRPFPASEVRVPAKYQAQLLALFAVRASDVATQRGVLSLLHDVVYHASTTHEQRAAALKIVARHLDELPDTPDINERLDTLFARPILSKLTIADRHDLAELCKGNPHADRLPTSLPDAGLDRQAGKQNVLVLLKQEEQRRGDPDKEADTSSQSPPESHVGTGKDGTRIGRGGGSLPPDRDNRSPSPGSVKTTTTVLAAQSAMVRLTAKTQIKIIAQNDLIQNNASAAYYYGMQKLAALILLQGARARQQGVGPFDVKIDMPVVYSLIGKTPDAINAAMKMIHHFLQWVPESVPGLGAASKVLSFALEQHASTKFNEFNSKLTRLLDLSADNISRAADSISRALAMIHMPNLDDEAWIKSRIKKANLKYGLERFRGRNKNEKDSETYLRLLATQHIVEAILSSTEEGQGSLGLRIKEFLDENKVSRNYDTDHLKVRLIVEWHCENNGATPDNLDKLIVWGERDGRFPEDLLKGEIEREKQRLRAGRQIRQVERERLDDMGNRQRELQAKYERLEEDANEIHAILRTKASAAEVNARITTLGKTVNTGLQAQRELERFQEETTQLLARQSKQIDRQESTVKQLARTMKQAVSSIGSLKSNQTELRTRLTTIGTTVREQLAEQERKHKKTGERIVRLQKILKDINNLDLSSDESDSSDEPEGSNSPAQTRELSRERRASDASGNSERSTDAITDNADNVNNAATTSAATTTSASTSAPAADINVYTGHAVLRVSSSIARRQLEIVEFSGDELAEILATFLSIAILPEPACDHLFVDENAAVSSPRLVRKNGQAMIKMPSSWMRANKPLSVQEYLRKQKGMGDAYTFQKHLYPLLDKLGISNEHPQLLEIGQSMLHAKAQRSTGNSIDNSTATPQQE